MISKLRVTVISPGFVHTDIAASMTDPEMKAQIVETMDKIAIPPDAIARAIAFAIEQPADIDSERLKQWRRNPETFRCSIPLYGG